MSRSAWTQSRRATSDLVAIRDYTVATWGRAQASTYLAGIRIAIDRVNDDPTRRRRCGEELPDFFRLVVGLHVIFYREVDDSIRVERILHRRMDVESHL